MDRHEAPPDAQDGAGEGFLQRWSQRKLDAERAAPAPEPAAEDVDEGADAAPEAAPTDADMPPLETLGEDSDFSLFMSAGVSEALRRQALRKLFHSPKFNVRDGLCDYDDDYSGLSPLGDIVTAEMRRQEERLLERAKRKAQQWVDGRPGEPRLAANGGGESADAQAAQRNRPAPGEGGDSAPDADT